MQPEVDFSGRQWIGYRKRQEDYYCFCPVVETESGIDKLLLIVADGVGGETAGNLASKTAVERFAERFLEEPAQIGADDSKLLKNALLAANTAIADLVDSHPDLAGMGTTLSAVTIDRDAIQWISVGDSPIYLLNRNEIVRLSADHSMGPLLDVLVESGELTKAERENHPERNCLRSALDGGPIDLIDHDRQALEEGDILLVASDGIRPLSEEAILEKTAQLLQEGTSAGKYADSLVESVKAISLPKQDNLTVAAYLNGSQSHS